MNNLAPDILLVRMTSDSVRPPERRYGYPNAFGGLVSLVKEEGVKGLARGIGTNATRATLMNVGIHGPSFVTRSLPGRQASQVGSYDYFKTLLLRYPLPILEYQLQDNLLLHIIASCLAGTIATSSSFHAVYEVLHLTITVRSHMFTS